MAERAVIIEKKPNYFSSPKENIQFISSGCTVLDCALGGGWALGRMANIVGDKSTAKTALATEALINFLIKYPNGIAAYREIEAAYDTGYAEAMGLPVEKVDFGDEQLNTVEDFVRDVDEFIKKQGKKDEPGIYVLDSLDSLSDEAEMERDIGEGTYAMNKAKQLSTFFRTRVRSLGEKKILLLIVSQVRDNIGAMFGEKHKRAGGKAMDFYASQILWLSHIETLERTINKAKRPYGVTIRFNVKKNKVGLPFRKEEFPFLFGYGIENMQANIDFLKKYGRLEDAGLKESEIKDFYKELSECSNDAYRSFETKISSVVKKVWADIDNNFLPNRRKYV